MTSIKEVISQINALDGNLESKLINILENTRFKTRKVLRVAVRKHPYIITYFDKKYRNNKDFGSLNKYYCKYDFGHPEKYLPYYYTLRKLAINLNYKTIHCIWRPNIAEYIAAAKHDSSIFLECSDEKYLIAMIKAVPETVKHIKKYTEQYILRLPYTYDDNYVPTDLWHAALKTDYRRYAISTLGDMLMPCYERVNWSLYRKKQEFF